MAKGFHCACCLFGFDQKIPDWLIEIMFLGEAETVIRSSIESRFNVLSYSPSDAFFEPRLFSLTGLVPGA